MFKTDKKKSMLKKNQYFTLLPITIIGLLVLFYLSVFHLQFINDDLNFNQLSFYEQGLSFSFLLMPIFIFPKWFKPYLTIVVLLLFGFSVTQLFHCYMYSAIMPKSAYHVMMETSTAEVLEFIGLYAHFPHPTFGK